MNTRGFLTRRLLWIFSGVCVLANSLSTGLLAQGPNPNPPKTHLVRIECKGKQCCMYELDQYPGNVEMGMASGDHVILVASGRAVQLTFSKLDTSPGNVCIPEDSDCEPIQKVLNIPANQWAEVRISSGRYCIVCQNCAINSCADLPEECKPDDPGLGSVPTMLVVAK